MGAGPLPERAVRYADRGMRLTTSSLKQFTLPQPSTGALVAVWLLLVVVIAGLGFAAHTEGRLPGDVGVTLEVQEKRPSDVLMRPAMVAVSMPGYWPWAVILTASPIAFLALTRRRRAALFLGATVIADLACQILKLIVERPRPQADLVTVYQSLGGYSYPSGHVVHYVVFFGAVAYLAWLRIQASTDPRSRRLLGGLVGVCVALIVLVGPSRIYLGAHWPTDVLAGYLLGVACLALLIARFRKGLEASFASSG